MDLTALAYEVGIGEEDDVDDAVTSRLASPYGKAFSALTRCTSFSNIQVGHDLSEEKCLPLQLTQQIDSEVHSLPSWPSFPHFQHLRGFLQYFLE